MGSNLIKVNFRSLILLLIIFTLVSEKSMLFSSTKQFQKSQDSLFRSVPFDTIDSLMNRYDEIGYFNMVNENFEQAEEYLLKSLEIKTKVLSETDYNLGNSYVNLGVLYYSTWRFEEALENYRQAELIYRRIDSSYFNLGSVYVNEAIVHRILGDYEKAKNYCNSGIRIYKKQKIINYNLLSTAYYNLGIIYQFAEEYNEAILSFTKSMQYNRELNRLHNLNIVSSIAICYDRLENNETSAKYYLDAINIANSIYGPESIENAPFLMNLGLFYIEKFKAFDKGKELYDESLNLYLKSGETNSTDISRCFYNIGEYYYIHNSEYDKALNSIQKSLIYAEPGFADTSRYANPTISSNILNIRLLESIKLKAKVLLDSYRNTGNIKDLVGSLETFELAIENIERIRIRYDSEESRFIISRQQYGTFANAIVVANLLYDLTQNPLYFQKAMEFNERAKAFSLLISIRNLAAQQFGGIPKNLLATEKDLSRQLALYEELIFEEKKKAEKDQMKIELWEEKLFWLQQQNDILLQDFENSYPDYYKLKYDTKVISINDIANKLEKNTTLLEYFTTDTIIYIYIFAKDSYNLVQSKVDSNFFAHINSLRRYLTEPSFSSNVKSKFDEYYASAFYLYQTLIEPCKSKIQGNKIILIPDGELSYIPFEALLTFPDYSNSVDYRNLPYLLRDYSINYAYSATLHFEQSRRSIEPTKELLAIAPDYSNLYAQEPVSPDYLEAYRDNLMPIPGVIDEVTMISRLIPGDVLMDKEATESKFKETAGDYNILHLAMHTVVNNEDPMYSKLAFQQKADEEDDGFLNTYEIYNMRFNARMAVLSSCNTGYGKLMKGEGVMSLARGFMYAGCPSIVMTLWEVSDKSGARLMQNFYKYLKKGNSKSEALRQAKLDFLDNADNLKANPYFWSTYVIIGDADPLYPARMRSVFWIAGLLLVSGIVIIGLNRRRKKSREKNNFKTDSIYT
jgi:CHAT domain-containing protein